MQRHIAWRHLVAVSVLAATVVLLTGYWRDNPQVGRQLGEISAPLLGSLLLLYGLFVLSLALVNSASLRLCNKPIPRSESLLLTMYSSIINFFGPLQSGPAFRAVYLKHRHGVPYKRYLSAGFVYYGFYGLFNVLLLLCGLIKWYALVPVALIMLAVGYLRRPGWYLMAGATLAQVAVMVVIFWVELSAVAPGVGLQQVFVYTGAANLALFVSLTPGAIGLRESFLLLSQKLHGIDATTIVAANLIDRSVYVLMLLILVAVIFGTHANRRFQSARQTKSDL